MATKQPTLTYKGFEVLKVVFDRGELDIVEPEGDFKVSVHQMCNVHKDNKNDFISNFIISVTNDSFPSFSILVEAAGIFLINGNADETVYRNFTEISAPSIVYPYIRSFISNLTLQAGMNPLFIPSVNFANQRTKGNAVKTKAKLRANGVKKTTN